MYNISEIYLSTEYLVSFPEMTFGKTSFGIYWFTSRGFQYTAFKMKLRDIVRGKCEKIET